MLLHTQAEIKLPIYYFQYLLLIVKISLYCLKNERHLHYFNVSDWLVRYSLQNVSHVSKWFPSLETECCIVKNGSNLNKTNNKKWGLRWLNEWQFNINENEIPYLRCELFPANSLVLPTVVLADGRPSIRHWFEFVIHTNSFFYFGEVSGKLIC